MYGVVSFSIIVLFDFRMLPRAVYLSSWCLLLASQHYPNLQTLHYWAVLFVIRVLIFSQVLHFDSFHLLCHLAIISIITNVF